MIKIWITSLIFVFLVIPLNAKFASSNSCSSIYKNINNNEKLWNKFITSTNPFSKYHILEKLIDKHKIEDLPNFILLIQCDDVISREGDTVAEFAMDYLMSDVLIEFPYSKEKFANNHDYRKHIVDLYSTWYEKNKLKIHYDNKNQYFINNESVEKIKIHNSWYIKMQL